MKGSAAALKNPFSPITGAEGQGEGDHPSLFTLHFVHLHPSVRQVWRDVSGASGLVVVVVQKAVRRPFQIIELTALQRPPEHRADEKHQHYGQRDEQIEDVHFRGQKSEVNGVTVTLCAIGIWPLISVLRRSSNRSAFSTTMSELAPMPAPAIQGVTQPIAAAGTATIL